MLLPFGTRLFSTPAKSRVEQKVGNVQILHGLFFFFKVVLSKKLLVLVKQLSPKGTLYDL